MLVETTRTFSHQSLSDFDYSTYIFKTALSFSGLHLCYGIAVLDGLGSGTQDRGFAPGRSRRIFRAKKSSACLPSEGK
jgi:hypothetical protein